MKAKELEEVTGHPEINPKSQKLMRNINDLYNWDNNRQTRKETSQKQKVRVAV